MLSTLIMTLMFLTTSFLILLVLVQRGRGGGLAGALGGMGGQSAFGTKAGDTFTRITIGVAAFWIVLCAASVKLLGTDDGGVNINPSVPANRSGAEGGSGKPTTGATPAKKGVADAAKRQLEQSPAKTDAAPAAPRSGTTAPAAPSK